MIHLLEERTHINLASSCTTIIIAKLPNPHKVAEWICPLFPVYFFVFCAAQNTDFESVIALPWLSVPW